MSILDSFLCFLFLFFFLLCYRLCVARPIALTVEILLYVVARWALARQRAVRVIIDGISWPSNNNNNCSLSLTLSLSRSVAFAHMSNVFLLPAVVREIVIVVMLARFLSVAASASLLLLSIMCSCLCSARCERRK